jgi:hypothetical protein
MVLDHELRNLFPRLSALLSQFRVENAQNNDRSPGAIPDVE